MNYLLGLVTLLVVTVGVAADGVPTKVTYVSHDTVSATMLKGGSIINDRETAPDQTRAASVQCGETHHLTKGDVITIPAKTPHWFREVPTQTIAYYAVNTEP